MSKCTTDIRLDIIDAVSEKLQSKGAFVKDGAGYFPNPRMATPAINSINREFGEIVVKEGEKGSFFIEPSQSLVNEYFQEYSKTQPIFLQKQVNYTLKAVNILQSPKAEEIFAKGQKNNWSIDKILSELQIPQQQKELIKASGETTKEGILTSLLANYSYTTEINTAKKQLNGFDDSFQYYQEANELNLEGEDREKYIKDKMSNLSENTDYYSNLIVPGGTNYTENEIATPAITPSIKGHAAFATENGIGWFRSDDRMLNRDERPVADSWTSINNPNNIVAEGTPTKTRRILEVQSDLFQKGRDKENLVPFIPVNNPNFEVIENISKGEKEFTVFNLKENRIEGRFKTQEEANTILNKGIELDISKNGFLQLLNKDNNWVTFFIKSIIQDSAKKGYEKVLFPSGNTASKVEGHTTLEEFKKQKEDRIADLEQLVKDKEAVSLKYPKVNEKTKEARLSDIQDVKNEINQLKQELENVDKEGFGALKPIYKFYENTIKNILRKSYAVKEITDEYGNTWNEITISKKDVEQTILLQKQNTEQSKASPETLKVVKSLLNKWGVKIENLEKYAEEAGLDIEGVNGIADLVKGVIAIAEGREQEALTEEAIHIATAILEQTNPELMNSMLSKIHKFDIYRRVFEEYSSKYVNKDGTPNIRAIKKEAVDKLIAELVINKLENKEDFPELLQENNISLVRSWWEKILSWFGLNYKKSSISIFGEAADIILNHNIGNVSDIKSEGTYLQLNPKQQDVVNKLEETEKIIGKEYAEDTGDFLQNDEEANNWYVRLVDGVWKRIQHRVTDRTKSYYKRIFHKPFSEEEKSRYKVLRDFGIEGHKTLQDIGLRYVDPETHKLRDVVEPRPEKSSVPNDANFEAYEKLENYFKTLIKQYPKDSLFYIEKTIFDPNYLAKKEDRGKFADGEAGTIDLLILEPIENGYKGHIFDWKFMGDNDKYEDVASYKQGAYDIQLGTYKTILKNQYGIEKFGNVRAIPIMMNVRYGKEGEKYSSAKSTLKGIGIGSANVRDIEELKLLPVPILSERTGHERLDKVIDKLNNIYNTVLKERVEPELREDRKLRLQYLRRAIRVLQTQQALSPLQEAMASYLNQMSELIAKVKDVDVSKLSLDEKSAIAEDFNDINQFREYYSDMTSRIKDFRDVDPKAFEEIGKLQNEIGNLRVDFDEAQEKYITQLGESEGIINFVSPRKILKGIKKTFEFFDEWSNKTAAFVASIYNKASQEAIDNATDYNRKIIPLIESIIKNHGNFSKILKKDSHELISQISDEFSVKFKEASANGTLEEFLRENITDMTAYTKEVLALRDEKIQKVKDRKTKYDWQEDLKEDEIRQITEEYDPLHPKYKNATIEKHLNKDKWYSDAYRELLNPQNKDLLDFYHKILELNEIAYESGYIDYTEIKKFVPFMEQSLGDKIMANGIKGIWKLPAEFIKSLNASEKANFGYNEITGERVYTLPKPFTQKTGDPSKAIGQAVILYSQAMFKYQAMKQIEEQVEFAINMEKLQSTIQTTSFGDILRGDNNENKTKEGGSTENAKIIDDFVQYLIYNNRYPISQDIKLEGKAVLAFKALYNDKIAKPMGWEPIEEKASSLSIIKLVSAINRGFRVLKLGGNLSSGIINAFGLNLQVLAQQSGYYPPSDFVQEAAKLNRLTQSSEKEGDTFISLINEFKPLTENANEEFFKKAAQGVLNKLRITDRLMAVMSTPELQAQYANFMAVLRNMIVVDGKFRNVEEYVKSKYPNRNSSSISFEKRQEIKQKIKQEIQDLKKESVANIATVNEKNELVIPGFNMDREELNKVSLLAKSLYRRISGQQSGTSINRAKLDITTDSIMVFKNWIPKLWFTRFGELKKQNDPFNRNAYDVGRIKVAYDILIGGILNRTGGIMAVLKGTDEGMKVLDNLYLKYAEEYNKDTGEEFHMDIDEFKDMITRNLQNQMRELGWLVGMMGAAFSLGFIQPPDDKEGKSALALVKRMTDQFEQELSFFYNPVNWQNILSGGMFPAIGLINDIEKFYTHLYRNTLGYDFSHPLKTPEEVRKDSYPIKYGFKLVPGAAAWEQYINIISPDLGKELGIEIPSESSYR